MGASDNQAGPKGAKDGTLPTGTSPYATGGGGVTFERKVAAMYLAHLLIGDAAAELGGERRIVSVAFQQAPDHPVDDLVVNAALPHEIQPSLVLAIAVRREPDLVKSDERTRKLVRDYLRGVIEAPTDGPEHAFALAVAGPQHQAKQLSVLADLARHQIDAAAFFHLVHTPNKFTADVRARLDHLEALVIQGLADLNVADPDPACVRQRTWELLSRLTVLMPRLEPPDETDWSAVQNSLIPIARGGDPAGASELRDRLLVLADDYAPKAATVSLTMLRRDAHAALDSSVRRNQRGWQVLAHLHDRAVSSVRYDVTSVDGARRVRLDRGDISMPAVAAGSAGKAVVVHGESGVGKSALVLAAATGQPNATQAVCINLRHLPNTTVEFESLLGCPLALLLAELSAPERLLVIDAADAVAEGMLEQLRYLLTAARAASLGVVAISASDNKQVVRDIVADCFRADVIEHGVPGLTDTQVDEVVATFGELAHLAHNSRSRELLRRPVIIDLFVRGGISGVPLSDADAMQQVWRGLVRRREQSDRGTPDARDLAMLRLADLALFRGDPLHTVGAIDPAALDGLRRDGLLRTPVDDPFKIGPEFAHDEVRRYAVARFLLADTDLTAKLLKAGVPRWTLGAARLACQTRLAAPDSVANPLHGRLARLQAVFDALVTAGHGERWGDVPGEALLTLGDSEPVLRDAWVEMRADNDSGLRRLARLIDQRLRDGDGLVRIAAVEPVVALLLDEAMPWSSGAHVQDILRDWLRALVFANTPAGCGLRLQLGERLIAACAAADRRLEEARAAAAAARAARTPEEIEKEREFVERNPELFIEIGYPRSRRRQYPEVPTEIKNKSVVELLALLGPDLGVEGEAILRRVGQHAASWLAPALEEVLTGRALATYRRGFLAELTAAYYLDEEEDGSGFHEDGIRGHQSRSLSTTPLAAWYRGPFMPLFQTDFRNGVAVLNRMLNHAALARARTLAGLHRGYGASVDETDLDEYRTELEITGTRRVYIGDGHVWIWYRGSGVGPYPCMSALQALERVCDELTAGGVAVSRIVAILLDGCENLAMVGLVVGLLVRHLERADRLLDPYLAEPMIWREEFNRVMSESSGLAARSDGIVMADRRKWSLRETATYLVVRADETRAAELKTIGERLVNNTRRLITNAYEGAETTASDKTAIEEQLAPVRAWASGLDRDTYEARRTDTGLYIQSHPPDDVVQALQRGNEELQRGQEALRLFVRYHVEPKKRVTVDLSATDLAADLSAARDLLNNPPARAVGGPWDAPTAVAAAAIAAHLLREVSFAKELLVFAVDTVLRVGVGAAWPREFDSEESYYEQGADRSAARTVPLLLLPSAKPLLALVDGNDGSSAYERVTAAGVTLARAVAHEVRLHLARGLDRAWEAPCTKVGRCHHEVALDVVLESMRDCAFGDWDRATGQRRTVLLTDPIETSLANTSDKAIYFSRLDAAIRALAPASAAHVCVSARARAVLDVVLAAHRRSLLAYERDMDNRGTHALVCARALLTLAADGDDAAIFNHIDAFADNATLLGSFLRALSAAAEESASRAATARRVWPAIIERVLELNASGHALVDHGYFGGMTLAALLPNAAGEVSYLYRELDGDPIVWWEPFAWRDAVERWLPVAVANPSCVDHLISFLGALPPDQQVRLGLQWVSAVVLPDPESVARGSFLLSSWLIEARAPATDQGLLPAWQRVVDALVVAGVTRLAPYSE